MGFKETLGALVSSLEEMIDIVLILGILVLIIVILKIIEKELKARLELRRKDRNIFYRKELKMLSKSKEEPEQMLDRINDLGRDFFKEAFGFSYNIEYLGLVGKFRKIGKKECISFCRLISELNYSGEQIRRDKINVLINMLQKIIEKNKIISEEEKKILERRRLKNQKKQEKKKSFWRRKKQETKK